MINSLLWPAITAVISVLTYFGGKSLERRKAIMHIRLELLKPIEEWLEQVTRIESIIGDEVTSITQGRASRATYQFEDRAKTTQRLSEDKLKILGILESKSLRTWGTRKSSILLEVLVPKIATHLETKFLPAQINFMSTLTAGDPPDSEFAELLYMTEILRDLIKEAYGLIAILKTSFV